MRKQLDLINNYYKKEQRKAKLIVEEGTPLKDIWRSHNIN
jgi:hypothetical protein